MKYFHYYIFIVILSLWSHETFAQVNCITDPPLPPVLTTVSVQPETGYFVLTWALSTSPDIAGYVIYTYKNGDGFAIDTVWDPVAKSFVVSDINSAASKYMVDSFVVSSIRKPRCTSIFSNVLNSIFEQASIDTCLRKINIKWNSYRSVPLRVSNYSILLSVNGGSYSTLGTIGPTESSFTLNDYLFDSDYCFVVRANLENGLVSTSNKSCLSTKMQHPPAWINADQATIDPAGKIALSFTIDPSSQITQFSLERKTGNNGTFQEISRPLSSGGKIAFTDMKADPEMINYYRLSAVNSCNLPIVTSNLASNMVLSLERSGDNIILSWNSYKKWEGNVSSYLLFTDTGNGFFQDKDVPASDSVLVLGYQQIMYQVSGNKVCFFVRASEASNPHGISGVSVSSSICTDPTEIITVPNLFTPDNDLKNDLFRPVLSFTPSDYHLIISNRLGKVLFETRDYKAEWDGTQNGSPQPQEVYLWFVKLTTPSGKVITRTGTITIVRK
jgi:gliding motility-associated-like protein